MTEKKLNAKRETVEMILTEDSGMGKGLAKMVSQILSHDQKKNGLMFVLPSPPLSFSLSSVG
jgi:hypothetical protein